MRLYALAVDERTGGTDMLLVAAPPLRCTHLAFGAVALMAIYVALLIAFLLVASNAPPSTIIYVGG